MVYYTHSLFSMFRPKQRAEFITGLDIGSTAIRIAVGQVASTEEGETQLNIVGAIEVPSEGIQKGSITSIEETVSAIAHALESAEKITGVPIEHAWVGVSGANSICQDSRGAIAVARTDGEITEEDVGRVIEAARTIATPLNYELLHTLPRSFGVDGQTGIKDPVGMTGIRLEVEAKIIFGVAAHIKNITKAIYRTGIDIDDFVLSILAAGDVVTTNRQKELGVAVVNIGGPTTSLVVYAEGDIVHTAVIPIGASHITNDVALGLKTSIDVAERVKVEYGQCTMAGLTKKEMIDLAALGAPSAELASQYYVAQIIEARVSEILEKVDAELQRVGLSGLLPAGALFVGGGAHTRGLVELAREQLRLPVALGYPLGLQSITDKISDPSFAPAIGLVRWGARSAGSGRRARPNYNVAGKVADKLHKVFKSLVP